MGLCKGMYLALVLGLVTSEDISRVAMVEITAGA